MLLIVDCGMRIADCDLRAESSLRWTDKHAATAWEERPDLVMRTEVVKMRQKWCGTLQIVRICPLLPALSAFARFILGREVFAGDRSAPVPDMPGSVPKAVLARCGTALYQF